MSMGQIAARQIFDPDLVRAAMVGAARKLDPRVMARNPVMFVVEIGSAMTTAQLIADVAAGRSGIAFEVQITLWLWATVLFANFAEAMAEGRGKAQAENLRKAKTETSANRIRTDNTRDIILAIARKGDVELMTIGEFIEPVPAPQLRKGDIVVVSAGEFIPAAGEGIHGGASVDESAITGESAPGILR